jgi:hypothetical protein
MLRGKRRTTQDRVLRIGSNRTRIRTKRGVTSI